MESPSWDLKLELSGGLTLKIFCDHVPEDPSYDGNWELWTEHEVVAVGPGATIEKQRREEA